MAHLHIDCFVGISGDMTLAALIDLGADADRIVAALDGLGHHIGIEPRKVVRAGIQGTLAVVTAGDHSTPDPHTHRGAHAPNGHHRHEGHEHARSWDQGGGHTHGQGLSYEDCRTAILGAALSPLATERSLAMLRWVGEAEASVHGTDLEAVHFHELGGLDTLVDLCGTAVALEMLAVDSVSAGPIPLSHGWVTCAHGVMPVPPPAVAKLIEGLPVVPVDVESETVTPTGAAIVRGLADSVGAMPPMHVDRVGYGAGSRDLDPYPNLLRLILGSKDELGSLPRVTELCTQVDDCSPEVLAHATGRLMEAGALDVYLTPVTMKKGRLGTAITVVSPPGRARELCELLVRETSTIGVRFRECSRMCLPREVGQVQTPYGLVTVKWARLPDGSRRASPEYDDCVRIAREASVPVRVVYDAAMVAAAGGC